MRKAGLPIQKILSGQALLELAHDLRFEDMDSLYSAIGDGHISSASVVEKLIVAIGVEEPFEDVIDSAIVTQTAIGQLERRSNSGVHVEGVDDLLVKLARCCTPVPGDEITGFITRGSGVSVHRSDCINLEDLRKNQNERLVEVRWNADARSLFMVNIQVEALDRSRLLSDVTKALSDQHVNILNASVHTAKDRTAYSRFTFEMADASHLDAVLSAVRAVDGVYDVYRVTNS
jgi:GTP pyrophosphokinase